MLKPLQSVHEALLTHFVRTRIAIVEGALLVSLGLPATYTTAVLGNAVVGKKDHGAEGLSWELVEPSLAPLQEIGWC